jgi:hypothetical protein
MEDLTVAYVTLGAGVVLLVLVAVAAAGPVRRFARANAALRAEVARRTTSFRALMNVRRRAENDPVQRNRYTRTE